MLPSRAPAPTGWCAIDLSRPRPEHVLAAEELGDVAVLRPGIDLPRRTGLPDLAVLHHHDHVGKRDRLHLGVGDMDEGDAEFPLHAAQLLAHLHAQLLVERRERLVEQQHARFGDRGTGQRDALLLAAGELAGRRSANSVELDLLDHRVGGTPRSVVDMPRTRSAKAMLSRTVRCGNSA